jgi:hypothetical protein
MKKLSLLAMVLLMSLGGVHAQQKQVKLSARIGTELPKEVIAAVETKHPGLNIQQDHIAAAVVDSKDGKKNKISLWPARTYHLHYKGRNYHKSEIYDQKGNLLHSRESISNIAMPHAVYRYIGKEHNGWLVKKTKVVKTIEKNADASRQIVYYKVLLRNGLKKQWVQLTKQGEIYARK